MELLFTLDEKNYTNDMPIFERYGVRAIIKQNHKFAMQQGNSGEYKMPGGGVEHGENFHQALIREVREETGLLVRSETIKEIGEVLEIRADIKNKGYKYIAHTLYYECEVSSETVETSLTKSEVEKGYRLAWAEAQNIMSENKKHPKEYWMIRDMEFLKWYHSQHD